MTSYCLIQQKAVQGHGCPTLAQSGSLLMAPFLTLNDAAAFCLGLKRTASEPTLGHIGLLILQWFSVC